MDMEVIDTVRADTLQEGDIIAFGSVLCEIKEIDEGDDFILFISEDDRELTLIPFQMVDIWGYV